VNDDFEHNKGGETIMPIAMKTLDKIAREKQRDVLYITFRNEDVHAPDMMERPSEFDWQACAMRKQVIRFLEDNGIAYTPCFSPQPTNGVLILASPYYGEIYIDLASDPANPKFRKLEAYLETSDGERRYPEVTFWQYGLDIAMENTEHDEPGFWDNM